MILYGSGGCIIFYANFWLSDTKGYGTVMTVLVNSGAEDPVWQGMALAIKYPQLFRSSRVLAPWLLMRF